MYKFIKLPKLFILAVAIIGLARKQDMIDDAVEGAMDFEGKLFRQARLRLEDTINMVERNSPGMKSDWLSWHWNELNIKDAVMNGVHMKIKGFSQRLPAMREHNGTGSAGEAYGVKWSRNANGARIDGDVMVAHHNVPLDTQGRHAFPDMTSTVIPPIIHQGEEIEYWDESTSMLRKAIVSGYLWVTSQIGDRVIWGHVPSFVGIGNLVSGTPIFRDGKLVSVITKSRCGVYAITGIASTSGHALSYSYREREVGPGQSVYGNYVGPYATIKAEATRPKGTSEGPLMIEIVHLPGSTRIIGWKGDNHEVFHMRT